ncbi:MAG: polyamine aminopropyltransferase, partial [Nitrospirae bacterium]
MELWIDENHEDLIRIGLKVIRTLYREHSKYQEILIVETVGFGRVLLLDGVIQTTEGDEFFYHEMLVHVPLFSHPEPENLLVIGGGDGGAVREALKHSSIKRVVHVEIDEKVVEACKIYLPGLSYDDERVELNIADGVDYVKKTKETFDIVIIDSTDPVGPAKALFEYDFYKSLSSILSDRGVIALQSESPIFHKDFIGEINNKL